MAGEEPELKPPASSQENYCLTTDIWTDLRQRSFMAGDEIAIREILAKKSTPVAPLLTEEEQAEAAAVEALRDSAIDEIDQL
ncbi:hypothetical protein L916_10777, partial [Phytophthora nicotianae]